MNYKRIKRIESDKEFDVIECENYDVHLGKHGVHVYPNTDICTIQAVHIYDKEVRIGDTHGIDYIINPGKVEAESDLRYDIAHEDALKRTEVRYKGYAKPVQEHDKVEYKKDRRTGQWTPIK